MPIRETFIEALPFLMVWSLLAGIAISIGRKKGISIPVAILGAFPLWVAPFAFWLFKQPDIETGNDRPDDGKSSR